MTYMRQNWLNKNLDIEILIPFTYNYLSEKTAKDIADFLQISKRTISRKLNKLVKENILDYKIEGRNKKFKLKFDSIITKQFIVLAETLKTSKFLLKYPKIAIYLDEIKANKIIFGSYAKTNNIKNSDLDILFINIKKIDYELFNIHAQFGNLSEIKSKLNKGNTLLQEIANNHIILGDINTIVDVFWSYYENKLVF